MSAVASKEANNMGLKETNMSLLLLLLVSASERSCEGCVIHVHGSRLEALPESLYTPKSLIVKKSGS